MTGRDLAADVAQHVAAHPGQTLDEIARAIHARSADVRAILRAGGFHFAPRDQHAAQSPFVYRLASVPQDGRGRADKAPSQVQRILAVLRDGRPHRSNDLYRLGTVAHSRIAELRGRGYRIDCWRDGDTYYYRLHDEPERSAA